MTVSELVQRYQEIEHPSSHVLESQRAMVMRLRTADSTVNPNSFESVKTAIARMSEVERIDLLQDVKRVFIETNTCFTLYLADATGLSYCEEDTEQLFHHASELCDHLDISDIDALAAIAEGCAPFTVVGMLRRL
ncbi:MAG: hypothetical protein ACK5RL_20295 [Acidimicrobiales bacterium]